MTEYLTIEQTAERLHVSRNTVKKWIADGLPVLRLSERVIRIPADWLDEWLKIAGTPTSQQGSTVVDRLIDCCEKKGFGLQ
jgi:excisionase family DNA binding protein